MESTRSRVLEVLRTGGSRAEAARRAGIHPSQLCRWIERGRRTPGGRFAEFAAAVDAAERGDHHLIALQQAQRRWDDDPMAAFRWLIRQGEFDEPEPAEPVTIEIRWPWTPPNPPGDIA